MQKTIYKSKDGLQRLVTDDEFASEETLWLADDLEDTEINISRDELREMMPVLQGWLDGGPLTGAERGDDEQR